MILGTLPGGSSTAMCVAGTVDGQTHSEHTPGSVLTLPEHAVLVNLFLARQNQSWKLARFAPIIVHIDHEYQINIDRMLAISS